MQKSTHPGPLDPSSWADWPYFLAAYRTGSLSRAARHLGVEQSTVSRRVARLEELLGQELFLRGPGGLVPTEAAREVAPQIERGESALLDALSAASDQERTVQGRVRVSCPESVATLFVVPALPRLRVAHPLLQVELHTSHALVDLTRREADLALRGVEPQEPDLICKRVARFSMGVFAHRSWLDCQEPAPWIGISGPFEGYVEGAWDRALHDESVVRCDSYLARHAAALSGVGRTVLPRPWGLRHPDLVELPVGPDAPPPPVRTVYLTVHRALRRVPRIAAAWDFLAQVMSELDE